MPDKKYKWKISCLLSFLLIFFFPPLIQADEAGGGEVKIDGEISFYDETSSTKPSDDKDQSNQKDDGTKGSIGKGRLPQTNEQNNDPMMMDIGITIVAGISLFWFFQQKKEGDRH